MFFSVGSIFKVTLIASLSTLLSCGNKLPLTPQTPTSTVITTEIPSKKINILGADLKSSSRNYFVKNDKKYFTVSGKAKKKVRILSLDGGGIRGLYEAFLLAFIESYTGYKISELFQITGGTSTGGLATLPLSIKDEQDPQKAKYRALNMVQVYYKYAPFFFQPQDENSWDFFGILTPRYSPQGIEEVLFALLGTETKLEDAINDVSSFAFDLNQNRVIQMGTLTNFSKLPMIDAIKATAAAPTFFTGIKVKDNSNKEYSFIDGGVGENNPALNLLTYGLSKYDDQIENVVLEVYSLGTGEVQFDTTRDLSLSIAEAAKIVDLFITSENNIYGDRIADLVKLNAVHGVGGFYRLQHLFDKASTDDASENYRQYLIQKSIETIQSPIFNQILSQLPRTSKGISDYNQIFEKIKKGMKAIHYNDGLNNFLELDAKYLISQLEEVYRDQSEMKKIIDSLYHEDGTVFTNEEKQSYVNYVLIPAVNKYCNGILVEKLITDFLKGYSP